MTARIKESDLKQLCQYINDKNKGVYKLEFAYGMVRLVQLDSEGRMLTDITGYGSKKEVYNAMRFFNMGL